MADDPKNDAPLNAVVITREFTDEGVSVNVGATGDVKQTEIGDILRSALVLHDRKFKV